MIKNKKIFLFILLFPLFSFATPKKYDVVSIGKAMVDIVVFVSDEELSQIMPKNFKKADTNKISAATLQDMLLNLKNYQVIPGGSEANVIVDIASLGGKTAFNTIAAKDKYGMIFKESLEKENVAYLSKINNDPTKRTALCLTFITPDKERTFAVYSDLTEEIDESYINFDAIKSSKVFYTDASNLDGGKNKSKITNKAIEIAKKHKTKIAFNLNNNHYVETHRNEIIKLLKNIDIFVGSRAEVENLYGVKTLDAVIEKVLETSEIAVITSGKNGAVIATKDKKIEVPTQVTDQNKIKDLNGAGDAFIAGFLYGYTRGFSIEKSGEIAAKAAAEIIYNIGARPNHNLAKVVLEN